MEMFNRVFYVWLGFFAAYDFGHHNTVLGWTMLGLGVFNLLLDHALDEMK